MHRDAQWNVTVTWIWMDELNCWENNGWRMSPTAVSNCYCIITRQKCNKWTVTQWFIKEVLYQVYDYIGQDVLSISVAEIVLCAMLCKNTMQFDQMTCLYCLISNFNLHVENLQLEWFKLQSSLSFFTVSSFSKSDCFHFIANDEWPQFIWPQSTGLSGLGAMSWSLIASYNRSQKQFPSVKMHYQRKPLTTLWKTTTSDCRHVCQPMVDILNI